MKKLNYLLKKLIYRILYTPTRLENGSTISGRVQGLQNVELEGKNSIPDGCNFSRKITLGFGTTLGYHNVIHGDVEIGRYCQLGFNVAIISIYHPVSHLTTYINKTLFDGELKNLRTVKKIVIGHDVWIGHNAVILGGVCIGNGAIIAAGSVVTKDVAPYSVVGGSPAKVIRKRFDESVVEEIEELKWWYKNEKELDHIKGLFFRDYATRKSIYLDLEEKETYYDSK